MGSRKITSEELASLEAYVQSLDTSGRPRRSSYFFMILPSELTTYQKPSTAQYLISKRRFSFPAKTLLDPVE